jgi:hypothetical protein
MVQYPKPFPELVKDAHRMRSEHALSFFKAIWCFMMIRPKELAETQPVENHPANNLADVA